MGRVVTGAPSRSGLVSRRLDLERMSFYSTKCAPTSGERIFFSFHSSR